MLDWAGAAGNQLPPAEGSNRSYRLWHACEGGLGNREGGERRKVDLVCNTPQRHHWLQPGDQLRSHAQLHVTSCIEASPCSEVAMADMCLGTAVILEW